MYSVTRFVSQKWAVGFVSLFLAVGALAQGQDASATDLRAAFCVKPLKERLRLVTEFRTDASAGKLAWSPTLESSYQDTLFRHNKLMRYMFARLPSFGQGAMLEYAVAHAAGNDAVQRAITIGNACFSKYQVSGVVPWSSVADLRKCSEELGLGSLRLEQCNDLSFLPY